MYILFKNTRVWLFTLTVALLTINSLAEESPTTATQSPQENTSKRVEEAEENEVEFDPFSYNQPAHAAEFIPYEEGTIPPGIEVAGIAVPQHGESVAALYVPGYQTLFYVRVGDIIAVSVPPKTTSPSNRNAKSRKKAQRTATLSNTQTSAQRSAQKNLSEEMLYIKVGKINAQQVELHPMTHPENVRILR